MNKRFSTLLAAALVAGGLSANATNPASPVGADYVEDGSFIFLKQGGSTDYLTMEEDGTFAYKTIASSWADNLKDLNAAKWQVTVTEHKVPNSVSVYTYSFTNKLSGQILTINLQSNSATGSTKDVTKNETKGNTDWSWDNTLGLYAVKSYVVEGETVDSVYVLDKSGTTLQLKAFAWDDNNASTTTKLEKDVLPSTEVTLTADDFNAILTDGKLYFPDANVSEGQKNVLEDYSWRAVPAAIDGTSHEFTTSSGTNDVLFLTNDVKRKGLDDDLDGEIDKLEYLVVDYTFHDTEDVFNKLVVDTVAVEPAAKAVATFGQRTTIGKRHPASAAFEVKYNIAKDSLIFIPKYVQKKIEVATTLNALGTKAYGSMHLDQSNLATYVSRIKTAVETFSALASANIAAETTFEDCDYFNADGSYNASGSGAKGSKLIEDAENEIKRLEGLDEIPESDENNIKIAEAYLDAIDGLVLVERTSGLSVVTTNTYKEATYVDGVSPLEVTAVSGSDPQVVIRELAGVKVLTIADADAKGNTIITIRTTEDPTIGGDAEIEAGLYFVKDMKRVANGAENAGYGKFYDESPVNAADYVGVEQAFNPYAIYKVENAAGSDKGNYIITNLGTGTKKVNGVTNEVAEGVYKIGKDTISLVAAGDEDDLDVHIGYKYITANDAVNNKFTITSAAEMLAGQSIIMTEDSTLAIADAEGEVLYTLVPGKEDKYGIDDKLVRVPYTIMNADSAYVIEETYKFSNGKYGEANGTPAQFYLIAVDAESTYVLFDEANSKKLVVSTQYKTISAEDLDARNDMFVVEPQSAPASYMSLPKHVRLNGADGNTIALNSQNQGVAVREGDELKAAYEAEDFTFWLDTAAYKNANPFKYYVTKGVAADEEAGVAASRLFMYSAVDSVNAQDKDLYTYGNGAARVIFRTAEVLAKDTLLVEGKDTVAIAKGTSVDGLKHAVKAGVNNFQFSFEYAGETEGEYNIVCRNASNNTETNSYVHNINGVLVMGAKEDALIVTIEETEAPTANDEITASEVKVIAGNGQITISGAAGKKVVVSNILGQVVANTVITSDNATIAAPQGVVVVAVEGEEAVKAIVK